MRQQVVNISKPFYVVFAVLELSKLHMYRFHYDYMMEVYGPERCKLLFTDTDSFLYEVQTEDIFEDNFDSAEFYDFSNYKPNSKYFSNANKQIIGKFKDEAAGEAIFEFIGLRAKMYSFITVGADGKLKPKHRAKGLVRATSAQITHEDFLAQLELPVENRRINRRIGSSLHNLFTYEINKRALCAYDDKRFILDDGINTLAYGHFAIPQKTAIEPRENNDIEANIEEEQPTIENEQPTIEEQQENNTGYATHMSISEETTEQTSSTIVSFEEFTTLKESIRNMRDDEEEGSFTEGLEEFPDERDPREVVASAKLQKLKALAHTSSFPVENHRMHKGLIDHMVNYAQGRSNTLPQCNFINEHEMKATIAHVREQLFLNFREFGIRKKLGDLIVLFRTDHTRANLNRALQRMFEQEAAAREAKRPRREAEIEAADLAAADDADRVADIALAENEAEINDEVNSLLTDF